MLDSPGAPVRAAWPRVPRRLTLLSSLKAPRAAIGTVLDPLLATYGDTVRLHLGGVLPTVVTRDPALAQHILQKNHRRYHKSDLTHGLVRYLGQGLLMNEGADWLRQRRLIQPGFHRQRLAGLTRLMRATIDEWVAELLAQTAASQPLEVDVLAAATRITFRVVARSIFGNSLADSQLTQLSQWLTEIQAFYVNTVRQPYLRPWYQLRGRYRHHDALAARLRELVRGAIRHHQAAVAAGAPPPDDLLQMLLDARYEDTGEAMSENQLVDELNILLVAGHETSANTLAWAFYLLARHPAAQARLVAEVAQELPAGQAPEFADLARLPYTLQVVQEAMRLYPPAWVMDRVAMEDDEFQGQRIARGTLFTVYLYGLHHHPALWPDAEQFRPERFAADAHPPLPSFGYLPFGSGPRLCVGNHFALAELQLVLVQVLRQYHVELLSDEVPTLSPLVMLRPAGSLRLRFRQRNAEI